VILPIVFLTDYVLFDNNDVSTLRILGIGRLEPESVLKYSEHREFINKIMRDQLKPA